uniref:Ion_trans_2 domain-containing protein n=1 Tax=Mesocestoides corti TaxID=53468 RepID=A0A5K3FEE4_MESCO
MMLLFLANLGSLMADVFRIAYKKICCRFARDRKQESPLPTPSSSTTKAIETNGMSKAPAAAAAASSPSLTLRNTPGRAVIRIDKKASALQQLVKKATPLPGVTESLFITLAGANSVFTRALRVRKESRSVRIPVWLILCSFFLYLFMGAMIFAYWENWTFLDAMYFVFVTVSTIGFGDMLPGMDDAHPVHRTNKFISALVYLLFGLAMVAMCFDLIQLEVKRKSKRLARRIGLISSM